MVRTDANHPAIPGTADVDVGIPCTSPQERRFLEPLLSTLNGAARGVSTRVILVDNATRDGVEHAYKVAPRATVLRNTSRLSYAANLNRVLQSATARYVLLMNPDMYFNPDEPCLRKMVDFMDARPDCGLSICRIYHPDGAYAYPARRYQTWQVIAARRLGMSRLFPQQLRMYLYQDHAREENFECDWVSGCFMFARRAAIEQVGEFDTSFQKYFEDVDYAARMTEAGWRVMLHGGTYCYHHEQRASKRLLSRDAWLHVQAYFRWLRKWGFAPARRAARHEFVPAGGFQPVIGSAARRAAA